MQLTNRVFKASAALVIGLTLLASIASAQGKVSPDEARAMAKEAYIFHYPLVYYYRTMYRQAIDPQSDTYRGFGKWLHLGVATPADQDIPSPNNDSPYSYAWIDLRAEPWVLTMPKIEKDRFYTSQWDDMWGFVIENSGSVFDGNDGINVMFASPTWKGAKPDGVERIVRGDSDFLGSLTRTQLKFPEDLPNVKRIQGEYKLQPLSAFLGKPAPTGAPEIQWMAWKEGVEETEEFWSYANFLLQFTTPNPEDAPVQARAAKIGIAAGQKWDPASLDPELRKAIAAGMQDAMDELQAATTTFKDASLFFRTRKDLDKDYFNRALGILVGAFGNWKSISVYFAVPKDDQGELFDGSKHSYTLTFSKDQIPPVKYFWSWTMYKLPQRYLVDNPIDRYSIGSATPGLKTAADGSITLYFSVKSPGKDKESNWLPAPEGPFWLVLRTYGPGEAIENGEYKLPPIEQDN
ncbi:MAG TPA: DUF1254 domain-containing protein [Chromatiaceae bacterium]|jgi:hypothetical protein|nr:MAG: DUF1254 domain-containing protein [Thiohalocapsa sp. PB-PSB1]HBG93776.1 DUF1254 domain-containing protein [Chromatiaceae bacterium]HCS91661.1 DUF1254 domain-containing protein [Chromatiaceae bacterium]